MVPYFGRHSCKQFIRSKHLRFGYKLRVLCSSNGLPYRIEMYEGKTINETGPLGPRVVLGLLKVCENPANHHVFVDNFFSSYDLHVSLKKQYFRSTGIVRENRHTKVLKKQERGSYDYRSDGILGIVK